MNENHCWECGKARDVPHTCSRCRGTGEIDPFIFFKKSCPTCLGSGILMRCPDHKKHSYEIERRIIERYRNRFGTESPKKPSIGVCSMCGGTGKIPGSPDRTTVTYWHNKPCPRCHGFR